MPLSPLQIEVIKACQKSVTFFLDNFGKVEHPSAGVIPFKVFKYQKTALSAFKEHRFVIFRKCRQSGLSTVSGAFALWYAMFFPQKRILIVSRTENDAKNFLQSNIKFPFKHLPKWMRQYWNPVKNDYHSIEFPNGSTISSLTSHPDVLRSNAASLNVIDECGFIDNMNELWAAGYPTMTHGGKTICISTVNGVGNWYWNTWMDAVDGANDFYPIQINWWDMDWEIPFFDPLTGRSSKISPADQIRKCNTVDEIEKYGPYWSPWLEKQYRSLQERGEDWKFRQEVLAEFIGSGNTVVPSRVINAVGLAIDKAKEEGLKPRVISQSLPYTHPTTGQEVLVHFSGKEGKTIGEHEGAYVYKEPYLGQSAQYVGGRMVHPESPPHSYVMGVDLATGKGADYHAFQIIDANEMEQVCEGMLHGNLRDLKYILDYLGRWYNNALMVIERNNGGDGFIEDMRHHLLYPNIWQSRRMSQKNPSVMHHGEYGFMTTSSSKPKLNKALLDYLREDDTGIQIYSPRLHRQIQIYVRKKTRFGQDTNKTEAESGAGNHDDLVMAFGMALYALSDVQAVDRHNLVPLHMDRSAMSEVNDYDFRAKMLDTGDVNLLYAVPSEKDPDPTVNIERDVLNFTNVLMSTPLPTRPVTVKRKHVFK